MYILKLYLFSGSNIPTRRASLNDAIGLFFIAALSGEHDA